jgi:hypothetical protein
MSAIAIALVGIAAFLLGLRAGITIGYRAERRRKRDLPPARA